MLGAANIFPDVGDKSIGTLLIDCFLGRLVVCAQCTRSVHDVQGLKRI